MIFLRTQLLGTGTPADPYRAAFPTHVLVAANPSGSVVPVTPSPGFGFTGPPISFPSGTAIVGVDEGLLPAAIGTHAGDVHTQLGGQSVLTVLCPQCGPALNDFHDRTWKERAGTFRPVMV